MATTAVKPKRGDLPGPEYVPYETYLAQASETRIVEWVDGEVISYMPPTPQHQHITWFLLKLLTQFVEALGLGLVGAGPLEFKLWPGGPSREPDAFFISNERLPQLGERRFDGAPDLVIEVVSASSAREDKVRKFSEYEQAGVREYWIIDPRPRQATAEFYRRNDEGIYEPMEIADDGRFTSAVLHGFWLNVDWLRQDPLPFVMEALADIFSSDDRFPPELGRLYRQLADLNR